MAAPRDGQDFLGAVSEVEAADQADAVSFSGEIRPRGDRLAVLVVVQVGLVATIGSMGERFPLARGAWLGLVLCLRSDGGEVAQGQTLGEFLGGFALLAPAHGGQQADRVGALEVTGEVSPATRGQVDRHGRAGLSVDGADAELVAVLLASGEPLHAERFEG